MKWKVLYYEDASGKSPMFEFIEGRKESDQQKLLNWIGQLSEHGPQLPRPYADLLTDGIHELRTKLSGDQVRSLYFFCYKEYIVLTHAFIKRQSAVPKKEIKRAVKCRAEFLERFSDLKLLEEAIDEKL
jgi:phage-related protein